MPAPINTKRLPRLHLPIESQPATSESRFTDLVKRLQMVEDYHVRYGQGPPLQERRTIDELMAWRWQKDQKDLLGLRTP